MNFGQMRMYNNSNITISYKRAQRVVKARPRRVAHKGLVRFAVTPRKVESGRKALVHVRLRGGNAVSNKYNRGVHTNV